MKVKNKIFILIIIIIYGFILRWQYLSDSEFPLNDGGMFYNMIQDIQHNNNLLPAYTTYNDRDIPFAYPPLPFYITIFLSNLFHLQILDIIKYLPFVSNLLAIPFIFLLVQEICGKDKLPLLTTFIWTIAHPSYKWLIMGGGLTRSLAYTFSIICLFCVIRYFKNGNKTTLLIGSIFGGLTLLSHLEIFWSTAITIFIFFIFNKQFKKLIIPIGLFFLGCLLIASSYIINVLQNHGIQPFLNSFSSGEFHIASSLAKMLIYNFVDESPVSFISIFSFLGILYSIYKKEFIYIVWFISLVILDPRSADRSTILPISILASIAITEIILPNFKKNGNLPTTNSRIESLFKETSKHISNPSFWVLGIIIFQMLIISFTQIYSNNQGLGSIKQADYIDMLWVKQNTPSGSTFLVLSSVADWQLDRYSEWFPVLANRTSINTVQGTEWLPNNAYSSSEEKYKNLKQCFYTGSICVTNWLNRNSYKADYIYITKGTCLPQAIYCTDSIIQDFLKNKSYENIYHSQSSFIFKKIITD